LENFENFFELDIQIKSLLYKLAPPEEFLSEEDKFKYLDKLIKSLNLIKKTFIYMTDLLECSENITDTLMNKFNIIESALLETDYTSNSLKKLYNVCFAKMDDELLTLVKKSFYGDASKNNQRKITSVLDKCVSINEMLHVLHVYMDNNKILMNKIPILEMKISLGEEDPIYLRGDINPIAKAIYDAQDENFDTGEVDIVALNKCKKILMLVRHRGHALSIQIEEINEYELGINYFIPKVHHYELIKNLRGLNNYKQGDKVASGSFLISKENVGEEIFEFVRMVPTDNEYINSGYFRM